MLRSKFRLLVAVSALACAMLAAPARAVVTPAIPTSIIQLNGPESAVWDEATGAWYISSGGFSGSGAVVKLLPGASTPETFVGDLNGPQGVSIHDGVMYVCDVDRVLVVDMDDPAHPLSIPTGGGASDVDIDPATGDAYVTDLGGGVVWRIRDGVSELFVEINQPDGIYVQDGGVFIANFGLGAPGGIFRFDIETKERTSVVELPLATLDGLEPDGDDWLTTDFTKGHFWRIAPDGTPSVVAQLLPGAADFGFDRENRIVAVPNLLLNFVVFMSL